MSYSSEVAKKEISTTIVLSIAGVFYATRQVDSGLVIDENHLILDDVNINGTALDIRQVSTPVGGVTFKLKDQEEYITKVIMLDPNFLLEKEVEVFIGFSTGSFDWADYKKVANTTVDTVTKVINGYSIKSKEVTGLITNPTYNIQDKLSIDILTGSLSLDLIDTSDFPTTGLIKLEEEFIRYNGIVDNTLQNLIRGSIGSTAYEHK